jgi:hypothetical protein
VVHATLVPRRHASPSSIAPSPSSSQSLQLSTAATHGPSRQVTLQLRIPAVLHAVMHARAPDPRTHSIPAPSSAPPTQSSLAPLQTSVAPGWIEGTVSSQSLPIPQPIATNPSMSASELPCRHTPGSVHESVVHATPSLQSIGGPATHPLVAMHRSGPLHAIPSSHAPSSASWRQSPTPSSHRSRVQMIPSSHVGAAAGGTQPSTASHVSSPLQNAPSEQSE